MAILWIGMTDVSSDIADLLRVRTRGSHTVLRFTHLGGRDHFHGFGDLARVLHTADLDANLFGSGHCVFSLSSVRPSKSLSSSNPQSQTSTAFRRPPISLSCLPCACRDRYSRL